MIDQDKLTTTQRGKIAELHVATALMAQSAGRLSPFEPISDDHGIDLVVLDKETGRALPNIACRSMERIKRKTLETRRLQHRKLAA